MFGKRALHLWFRHIAATKRPIVVGPWRTELGFEALYWLPWLTKWREQYGIAKERLIAVSRGGAACWYDAAKEVDLYAYAPVETVRRQMLLDAQRQQSVKQTTISQWERDLLRVMLNDLGIRKAHILHPSLMYTGLKGFFDGETGPNAALQQLAFAPIPTPHPPLALPLPEKFVAVSFYARHTWPLNEETKTWVQTEIDNLSKHIPIVLLESGLHTDEHIPFPIQGANILSLAGHVTPQNNLAVQSAVLNKAAAFVGTYGGTMQLAVRLKKPSAGFYTKFEGTCYAHKTLTEWLAIQQQVPCVIGRIDDGRFMREVVQA
jgi:hypothetical protein